MDYLNEDLRRVAPEAMSAIARAAVRLRAPGNSLSFDQLKAGRQQGLVTTVPEICAITGHSHAEANAILKAHYLAPRDPRIAW